MYSVQYKTATAGDDAIHPSSVVRRRGMSSSYQSLLSLSPADWIGASDHFEGGGEVSSYLSFDAAGGSAGEAAFHPEQQQQQAPAAPPEYCESGIAGSSSEGEPGMQSQAEASALSSEDHDK